MNAYVTLLLVSVVVVSLFVTSTTLAEKQPLVGVKVGDWITYSYNITGPPVDSSRNLTWYRVDVLEVDGSLLTVNKTALSVDGVLSSSVWLFDLAEGLVYGWVIIPANLSKGDSFFDAKKEVNITVAGEEQKKVLGAIRTVTYATDHERTYYEWDKASGVYVYTVQHTDNYTITLNAVATNLWSPQSRDQNHSVPSVLIGGALLIVVLALFLAVITLRRRK